MQTGVASWLPTTHSGSPMMTRTLLENHHSYRNKIYREAPSDVYYMPHLRRRRESAAIMDETGLSTPWKHMANSVLQWGK